MRIDAPLMNQSARKTAPSSDPAMDLEQYLRETKAEVDACLARLIPDEDTMPPTIHRAMRYSVFAGGKRIRPALARAAGECVGAARAPLFDLGAAVEMVHAYSLIHDDLPALDNDDMRRGRPTCHKVFGEAMAILAGDALLTLAFQVMADLPGLSDTIRIAVIRELAAAMGTVDGMIGGQVADLEAEGKAIDAAGLEYIHRSKTGALLTACVRCGALVAGAGENDARAITSYGRRIGLAFQVVDDILDVTTSSEALGKTAGKDARVKKATYPAIHGIEASREMARVFVEDALAEISGFGEGAEPLRAIAHFILERGA